RRTSLESIIRNPIVWSISRDALSARVEVPALLPGINFYMPEKQTIGPMYSIQAVLGIIPDLFYSEQGYAPQNSYTEYSYKVTERDWYPILKGSAAVPLEMQLDRQPPDQSFSLMLSVGIRFGTMLDANAVQQVKRAGNARVLGMA